MKREIISDKAQDYVSRLYEENEYPQYASEIETDVSEAFEDGARWRIDSVWHDASEKPNKNQLVLFECRKTYGKGYSVNFGENYELMKSVIVRWAYIINLIPD